ncbi:MAG TPA: beta-ketoacyl-[acyl-carrier-protein] synthase family protein [Symbiobacteriaceae bacterium]|nr:beta-ketoacyl-[acyl-carrier-protein] synthase family protein [Symbiobacteriaceae bacterium]
MERRRAVITGIGCITPVGSGSQGLWDGVLRGRSAVRRLDRFDVSSYRSQVAAQVDAFDAEAELGRKASQRMDRFAHFALSAAGQALSDAGLDPKELEGERVGVFMGSALGGAGYAEGEHQSYLSGGLRAVSPGLALSVFGGAAGCSIAIHYGLCGPNETNSMSCAAGSVAIGRALQAIRLGECDMVLAGGAEAPLAPLCYGAFAVIRAMSSRNEQPEAACRPFDATRDGFVMGEGAAVLVVEERQAALRRGARVYAELVGYGTSNDAYHMSAPRPDGSQASRAMLCAMQDAAVSPDDVGYINAHGSGTPLGDVAEAVAVRRALGAAAWRTPISGTKGLYGHPLGASGAIEAAITALALHHGQLPGTCNLGEPDPAIELPVLKDGLERKTRWALSNSIGFGGINACLAFARA